MRKNKTILILIVSLVITILSVGLLILFFKVIKNKNEHASVVLSLLEEKIREKEEARVFNDKVAEVKALQDKVKSHFLDSNKVDTFVGYLEQIGSDLGARISVENIDMPSKTENIISVKVSAVGTFQQVVDTVNYLENIPYQVNITQVYLNKNSSAVINKEGLGVVSKPLQQASSLWQANISFNVLSLN